ncbi:sensor domain-containing phosphodiesterase [Pseudarthrobacter sp. YS3]|uniref:sensor domain-containing phosphodiesterase n=1 Tax=Pseudarthrobacter sp. YS3 TaxID=3453718 RepID=UPI003EEBD6C9
MSFIGGHLLLCVLCVQIAFALAIAAGMHPGGPEYPDSPAAAIVLGSAAAGLILIAACTAVRGCRTQGRQRDHGRFLSGLLETVAGAGDEWLWAVDDNGIFTFSSRASSSLLGYDPADLVGKHITMLVDDDDLASARQNIAEALDGHTTEWAGIILALRHRDGTPVWMEASGKSRRLPDGTRLGSEGISRMLPGQTIRTILKERLRDRIDTTVRNGMILTAFQPVCELETGSITGVEALARFPDHDDRSPDQWFNEATSVGLGDELEFAALEAALDDAVRLPRHLTVALNLSPETCLDPRLPGYLKESGLALDRMVLELTERLPVDDYAPLLAALSPLREGGLRIAVDDAGSGFSSMRHILQLRPDIIKLDRSLIAGIDNNRGKQALGAAMVEFANQIGATIIAEGIETDAELTAVRNLGMTSGQGFFLGRPRINVDWDVTRI